MAKLNGLGAAYARALISGGTVDKSSSWSFSAEDGNKLLGANGDDWTNYGRHHLGINPDEPQNTKGHYAYPFAKDGTVYRSGLIAIRQRAAQQKDTEIYDEAGALIDQIDGKKSAPLMRAYSTLEIKSVNDELGIIEGVASTPSVDRYGDIVDPQGAQYTLPIPLLWQHNSRQPIGLVTHATVTSKGIEIRAKIAKGVTPAIDEAHAMIKSGLVRGLSIGFRALDTEQIPNSWGLNYKKWEWLELSAVTIPANVDASISAIKSVDRAFLAASGRKGNGPVYLTSPGVAGKQQHQPANHAAKEADTSMKTISEQIKDWTEQKAKLEIEKQAIVSKPAEEGRTLDADEKDKYNSVAGRIKEIDEHLEILNDMQKTAAKNAKAVDGTTQDKGSRSRVPGSIPSATSGVQILEPKLEKGIGFARYAMAMALARGHVSEAAAICKVRWPEYQPLQDIMKMAQENGGIDLDMIRKANVPAAVATPNTGSWAGPLVQYQILAQEFIEFLRPRTIIGQFGTGNIPPLNRVPFVVKVPRQTSGASGYWVGEGKPAPLTQFALDTVSLDYHKVATIAPLTKELVRFSTPSAEALVRNELANAIISRMDIDFVDPNKAASAGVSPASITNGVTAIVSGGDTGDDVRHDIQAIFAPYNNANLSLAQGVWIMNANIALALSLIRTSLGVSEFPGITMAGGTFQGMPVIVSQHSPTELVILVAANEVYLADDGNVAIDVSDQASLEMKDSALTQDGVTPTATSLVSLWQTGMLGVKAEREITWLKRRSAAVQYLNSVNWNTTPGSGGQ